MMSTAFFLVAGIASLAIGLLVRNPSRKLSLTALGAVLTGFGLLRLLMRAGSVDTRTHAELAYGVVALVFALWFVRRQLVDAQRRDNKAYQEQLRSGSALLIAGVGIIAVSLVGYNVFGFHAVRGAWIGGLCLLAVYLWHLLVRRSLEKRGA